MSMQKTKIDWCTHSLNPVVGCTYNCPFCYAKKMNDRFGWIQNWDNPQFFHERLRSLDAKKPMIIFMDSMSDIADWKQPWAERIYTACVQNPQHTYLFLTKRPSVAVPYPFHLYFHENKNWWIGTSVCCQMDTGRLQKLFQETTEDTNRFVSIEPILEHIDMTDAKYCADWVIIGAETGNRKDKIIPEKSWIDDIVRECRNNDVPIFMKESLRELMGDDFKQEFPWEV